MITSLTGIGKQASKADTPLYYIMLQPAQNPQMMTSSQQPGISKAFKIKFLTHSSLLTNVHLPQKDHQNVLPRGSYSAPAIIISSASPPFSIPKAHSRPQNQRQAHDTGAPGLHS
jgi:hypothetical protein